MTQEVKSAYPDLYVHTSPPLIVMAVPIPMVNDMCGGEKDS